MTDDYIDGAIRLSVNNLSNEDIKYVSQTVKECVEMLRGMWFKKG